MAYVVSLVSIIALAFVFCQSAPQISSTFKSSPVDARRYYIQQPHNNIINYNSDLEGQYIHDDSGAYYHDDSGSYQHDKSGEYVPDHNTYIEDGVNIYSGSRGIGGQYADGSSGGGSTSSSGNSGSIILRPDVYGSQNYGSSEQPSRYDSKVGSSSYGANSFSGLPVAGYGKPVKEKQGNAAGLYDSRNYAIIRKIEQYDEDGYHYLYQTENGISAEEEGHLSDKGNVDEAMTAKGYFSYTGPDNVVYTVEYTADKNGFVPRGAHLPTPPPVPEAIARSLEYQRSIGEL